MPNIPNFSQYPLLCRIQQNPNIKCLNLAQLQQLAVELRYSLMEIVHNTGGHLASNLGVVELSIALHYVFDSPRDALVWDVGHQSYVHKILTGRWKDFTNLRQHNGLYGFPRREESLHDHLNTGHAGTAVSAGLGLELGRRLNQREETNQLTAAPKTICIVGDASLTTGITLEAMNHCGHQTNRLVVVMNDNKMSISPNVGAISRILSRLTAGHSYVFLRDHINQLIRRIPLLGERSYQALLHLKSAIKRAVYRSNLFTEFGFKYIGPIDGHNLKLCIDTLHRVQSLDEPVFLHIRTQKGKGFLAAENAPEKYHGISPLKKTLFSPQGLQPPHPSQEPQSTQELPSFTQSFSAALMQLAPDFRELVCITAAMSESTGLKPFAQKYPERFFDVGIAEQHALGLGCGLALAGKLPLIAIYSTFMQRAIDQLIHDISLMRLPAILVCDRAGIVPGGDGDTHQGIYDIAHFRSIIGLQLYSPATQQQLYECLKTALQRGQTELAAWEQRRQNGRHEFGSGPTVIRLPKRNCLDIVPSPGQSFTEAQNTAQYFPACDSKEQKCAQNPQDSPVALPEKQVVRALLLCSGSLLAEAQKTQQILLQSTPIHLDVLQLCQLSPLPWAQIENQLKRQTYCALFCVEDGVLSGGIGEAILRHVMALQIRTKQSIAMWLRGVEGKVPQLGNYEQLLADCGLNPANLAKWIKTCCGEIQASKAR